MDFFDKLSNTISAAGKDGLNKAKELKDTAKITMDIKEREGAIQRLYGELGKAYYQEHKEDEHPEYIQISAIKNAFAEIDRLKAEKDEVQGIHRCPSCGNPVPPEARFCSNCGASCKIEPEFMDGEVVEEEIIEPEESSGEPDAVQEPAESFAEDTDSFEKQE